MDHQSPVFKFHDYHPQQSDFRQDIIDAFASNPRRISPKYFYDERGSQLFEAICQTPEYYLTRTETDIIRANITDIAQCLGQGCLLVEPGSGNSRKVRELLTALKPHSYLPIDISRTYLYQEAQKIAAEFPWLNVHAVCSDFTMCLNIPVFPNGAHRVAFFPGSSIGNFEPDDAVHFLKNIAEMVGRQGGLLIGIDLKKDSAILSAAYNDAQGLTAAFNRNLLVRINRELGANFNIGNFSHHAFYNDARGRMEMHLKSDTDQIVIIDGQRFPIARGESIHTENSYKYCLEEFQALAMKAGFKAVKTWLDKDHFFSVHYFQTIDQN